MPHWMRYWINLRRSYCRTFKLQRTTLRHMLQELGMEFSGRQHSGLDDARNIARVTAHLLEYHVELLVNERLLRRDRLEATGKEPSPVPGGDDTKEPTSDDDGDVSRQVNASDTVPNRRRVLPYKVITVSKNEFLQDSYEQCLTCDEEKGEENV